MLFPTIVDVSPKGQILIPAAIRRALNIKPKSQVFVIPDLEKKKIMIEVLEGKDIIDFAYGMLKRKKGEKSMTQELLEERKRDLKREEAKINYFAKRNHV